jgi:MarR family transcriptional regulator, organic hydroperoxide resistance regulator
MTRAAAPGRSDISTAVTFKEIRGLVLELGHVLDTHMRSCISEMNLTLSQATAVWELGVPLTMKQLADAMCCEPSNVTFIIDRLEAQGLLERRLQSQDRRVKYLVLSPSGEEVRARLIDLLEQGSPLNNLEPDHRELLRHELQRALKRAN